jgi:phage terminase Nu1 subunit (DNA packaging protein)
MNSGVMNSGVMNSGVMNSDILNSWKEIAAYMGRGVRTVQRWERELGLPVRRPRGRERSAVIALKADLDRWVEQAPQGSLEDPTDRAHCRVDHLQLRQNTELLKLQAAALYEKSQKLQAGISRMVELTAALNQKKPGLVKFRVYGTAAALKSDITQVPQASGRAAS